MTQSDEPSRASDRPKRIAPILGGFLDGTAPVHPQESTFVNELEGDLDIVFAAKATGFRELLLTIVIARVENAAFKSTSGLYDCSPRPLYEQSIRPLLEKAQIRCGQSGPLNVAKATKAIDDAWAAQRRPREAAQALVRIARAVDKANPNQLNALGVNIGSRLMSVASEVEQLAFTGDPTTQIGPLSHICRQLITHAPDGGNTAQRTVGILLQSLHSKSTFVIDGATDSASTTNATSRKPGDLSISDEHGLIQKVFEVTTKSFGDQRISECSQSLNSYRQIQNLEVTSVSVLCRAEDAPANITKPELPSNILLGTTTHSGYEYEFIELSGWIDSIIAMLTGEQRSDVFSKLAVYVNHFNTSPVVKLEFQRLLATQSG